MSDHVVNVLEEIGRGVLVGLVWMLSLAITVGLPLGVIFVVVYLAVKAAS